MHQINIKTKDGHEYEAIGFSPATEKEKELLDRDMPYKPDGIYRDTRDDEGQYFVFWGKCKCGSAVWDLSKFCDQCGQRLDWRKL